MCHTKKNQSCSQPCEQHFSTPGKSLSTLYKSRHGQKVSCGCSGHEPGLRLTEDEINV